MGSEAPDQAGSGSADDSTGDSSGIGTTTRRGVLVGLTTGAGIGLGAAAAARGPPDHAGNNAGTGNGRAPAGNDDKPGRGPPDQVIVGTKTQAAADEAAKQAREVRHKLDFGDHGKAVAGRFPEPARKGLANRPDVSYVEPDATFEAVAQSTPWGVDRVDADTVHGDGTTGDGADIAIIDSGIDSDHPDLVDNLGSGTAYVEAGTDYDGSSCSGNGNTYYESWDDDNDHGTHCAGIAAGVDNSEGVVGVAPGATLHAVKVLSCSGTGYLSDIAAGVEYTANQGWDVASMSLGSSSDYSTLKNACQYAADQGVLLVAAAGNDGPCTDCVSYPATYSSVVAVSATTSSDDLASFSSTGPEVDIAAPGSSILSTVPGGEAYFSGTSMACPHVSGVGGLLMANGYSGSEARSALQGSAEDIGLSGDDGGSGLLDAEGAVGPTDVDLRSINTTPGGASFSGGNGDYIINAAGADVWTSDDEYGALYKKDVSGDVVAQVTVESQENTNSWAKAGIMLANDITSSESSAGDVTVAATPGAGFAFQWDGDGDGFVDTNLNTGTTSYPCTLRVTKSGSEYMGEYSTDGGSTWTQIGSATIQDATDTQDVGIFTTSHNSGTNSTADFSGFTTGTPSIDFPSIDTTSSGSASFSGSGGSYTIEAAGADVWTSDDEYGTLYQNDVSGDVVARTTIESQEDTHTWAKAGLMITNDITAAGSSVGDVTVAVTPGAGFTFQWDDDGDGFVDTNINTGAASYPCDLRLTKIGSEFTGEYSTDGGSTWIQIGSATIQDAMDTQDVGIFATSHSSGATSVAEFSNFGTGDPSIDLSSVDTTGTASFSGDSGNYTIDASGADVWSSDDEYGALYQAASGDVISEVTVESQENTHSWAKAGIMVANDITAPGSSTGDVILAVTPSAGFVFQWDDDGDGFVDTNTNTGSASLPCTLRVTKSGSEFLGEYSTDGGATWTTVETVSVQDANTDQDIGLFTTSHDSNTNCEGSFSNFSIS